MFGYIVTNKPELKIKEHDHYREYYCGLCKTLRANHGIKSQFTLSNDMNFINILLTSLYEPTDIREFRRCELHPLSKLPVRYNKYSEYATDMTIVLTYLKFEDDIRDDNQISKKLFKKMFNESYQKVKNKYPLKIEAIEKNLDEIVRLEATSCEDLELLSSTFGKVMAEIIAYENDIFYDDLYKMGLFLGKFIYLMDAYDDIEDDIKNNQFNPLKQQFKKDNFDEYCFNILEILMSECCFYFDKLPIVNNVELLKNILYSGVWTKFEITKTKRLEKKNESLSNTGD